MPEPTKTVSWPDWETVRVIGRGSSGTVYEIQKDILVGVEKAALKVISLPQTGSDIDEMYSDGLDTQSITSTFQSYLKNVVAEYSLMRKLNSCPQIVKCDDVRYTQHADGIGWDIFIKMELLTPLTKALPQQIPEQTVIKIAQDMCLALEQCQKHGILHRDIKPQNIFATDDGMYKLGDFGIAKTVEKVMGGTKIGTYKYMAPEVYNNQPYGIPADIYSLGLVLYWMLNERRLPFLPLPPAMLGAGLEETARERRFAGEPVPPPKNGSDRLKAIVLRACAFDPNDRYQNATQMLCDLHALQGDPTPAADTASAPIPEEADDDLTMRVFVKPEAAPAPDVWQQAGDLGLGDGQAFVPQPPRPADRKRKITKKKKGISPVVWIVSALVLVAAVTAAVFFLVPWNTGDEPLPTVAKGGPVTVTFDSNGLDTQLDAQIYTYGEEYGTLPDLSRKGHTFEGWYTEAEGGKRVWNATEVYINTDHTLYAHWTRNTYTVELDTCGGNSDIFQMTLSYDQPYGELPKPIKKGYIFEGWFTEAEGGEQIWPGTAMVLDHDHTLYARWSLGTYTVTLDLNAPDGYVSKPSVSRKYEEVYGDLPKASRKGYTFDGWYTQAEGGKLIYRNTGLFIDKDHTLYAHWSVNSYTITLDANGGTMEIDGTKRSTTRFDLTFGQPFGTLLPRPTREGYEFQGWFTEPQGGVQIYAKTELYIDDDHTLYARWS